MKKILWLGYFMALSVGVQAGELFRWVDKDGKVHYGDVPPVDTTDVERKKFPNDVSQNADLPYETQRAQQNFPVTLYVGEVCGQPCDQARSLLNKRGVPFSEKLLKTQSEIEAFQRLSGSMNAPALQVGKTYISGYSESSWNSELDVAGYPKTASYRQRIAPPKSPAMPSATEGQTIPTEPAAQ